MHTYEYSRAGAHAEYRKAFHEKIPGYIRKLRTYLKEIFKTRQSEEVDILFLSNYRPVKIDATKGLKTDYLFKTIIEEIHRSPTRFTMALMTKGVGGKRYTDDRVHNFNAYDFLSLKILLKSLARSTLLYLNYRKITEKLSSAERKVLDRFFWFPHIVSMHLEGYCIDQAIESLNPKIIVSNDDSARLKPINSQSILLVLQSASIHEDYQRYMNSLYSTFPLENKLLSGCFCVSGPRIKFLKEKFGNDTKRVIVTGQPRYDKLAKANDLFDKNEICMKFGLNKNKKILLWATQTHALSYEENKKTISAVYQAASSLKNLQLVIKLHPGEGQEDPLYKEDNSAHPVIIKGDKDIDQLLYACDAFIAKSSTTVIEVAILNKPVIILNLSEQPDVGSYVKDEIALGVYKKEDLIPAIKDVLYNERIRKKLAKAREKFVYEYAYKQDGKAAQRVVSVIKQMAGW